MALVDPLPGGLEAQNPALKVTGSLPQTDSTTKGGYWWWWSTWYQHQNMRDKRVEAFTTLLWDGVHNYEYESDRFQSGIERIGDYLRKLRDYVRLSSHQRIELAVLEWNLSRTYDWRAGLHAAGSLILYETLGPELHDDGAGAADAKHRRRSNVDGAHLP